ncbi:hypothetical protein J8L73_10330 [Pseudoalteromonas sp. MMG006]|uniref:hypothetical protein n=1 Tax=Pseudoalteromonas sp. MMG006 TaxID=2822683 RepID=UPI001B37522D|nr:hypothetical protein [Pseudoalteromonas sp. MMG006]MBQ4799519.1 hypothetical protein [Pseudoalteromonas sp. MMG006]
MFKHKLSGVLIFLALFPIAFYQYVISSIGFGSVSIIQVSLLIFTLLLQKKMSLSGFKSKIFWTSILFLVFCTVSLLLNPTSNPYSETKRGQLFLVLLNMLIPVLLIVNKEQIKTIVYFLVLYSFFISILALLLGRYENSRLVLWDMNPIWLGRLALFQFLWFVILFVRTKSFLYLLLCGIPLFVVFKTSSIGPLLAVMLSLFFLIYCVHKTYKKFKIFYFIYRFFLQLKYLIFILLCIACYWFFTVSNFELPASFFYRKEMISNVFDFSNITLSGVGFGNFYVFGDYAAVFLYPHNIYAEAFLELGIIGLCLLILYTVKIFKLKKINDDYQIYLFVCTFYSFILALFSGDLMTGNVGIYVFPLLLIKYNYLLSKE